jgi:Ca-activated chloride channel homolog
VSDFGFDRPFAFIVGLLWLVLSLVRTRRRPPSIAFAPWPLLPPPRTSLRDVFAKLPTAFALVGAAAAVVALAGPIRLEARPAEAESVDIVLCLDVSSSMTARDMEGERTRLDVAKAAAAAFVDAREGDRVALVTFARYADLRCPFTRDREALKAILAETTPVRRA